MGKNRISKGTGLLGAIQLAGTDVIKGITVGSVSINPASIAAVTRLAHEATVTGAKVGDIVLFSPPAALNDDLIFCGSRVTDVNDVAVYIYNPTGGAIDDGALTWDYIWFDLTD